MKEYLVFHEADERTAWAGTPPLPGRIVTGETILETERITRGGVAYCVDGLRLRGQTIPEPAI